MTLQSVVQLVGLVSVAFSIWLSLKNYRRQKTVEMVMKYAERYEKIMDAFPREAFRFRFNLETELPPRSDNLTLAVLKYLNLCWEEYYLYKRGYLAKDVWRIWEEELMRMLQSQLFRREWEVLKDEFKSDPAFMHFVDEIQNETLAENYADFSD